MKVFVWCSDCAEFHECRNPTEEEDPNYPESVRRELWVSGCGHIIKVEFQTEGSNNAIAEIDKVVLEAENDPNVSEEEKVLIRDFASQMSEKLTELENMFKNGDEEKE